MVGTLTVRQFRLVASPRLCLVFAEHSRLRANRSWLAAIRPSYLAISVSPFYLYLYLPLSPSLYHLSISISINQPAFHELRQS